MSIEDSVTRPSINRLTVLAFSDALLLGHVTPGFGSTAQAQTANPNKNAANKDYFAKFANIPDAGNFNGPNWETIVTSATEVFFARRNSPWQDAVEKLKPFGIQIGTSEATLINVLQTFWAKITGTVPTDRTSLLLQNTTWELRLPRILLTIFGGAALATDHLIPELQRRGIFNHDYQHETLRQNLGV